MYTEAPAGGAGLMRCRAMVFVRLLLMSRMMFSESSFIHTIMEKKGGIDLHVNNAGYGV